MQLQWKVDECSPYWDRLRLRGWCFVPDASITEVYVRFDADGSRVKLASYGVPSPDVAAAVHPNATHARFEEWISVPAAQRGRDFILELVLEDGSRLESASVHENARAGDAAHVCFARFLHEVRSLPRGKVLEIGSRSRSAITRRELIPAHLDYVGADILAGPNVDVVVDAHVLSQAFEPGSFDAVFALSTFEHLVMPWKAVLEINRVLAPGGLVFIGTHQTWTVHEEPWDFWRFTKHGWRSLFNAATGFEILEAVHGEPAHIHAWWDSPITNSLPDGPAFLSSNVLARKVSDTELRWDVPTAVAAAGMYPPGELSKPPA